MPEIPEDHARAAISYLSEQLEVIGSIGRHEGHTLVKAGRCVWCSCNFRYQGNLPDDGDRAEARQIYAELQASRDG